MSCVTMDRGVALAELFDTREQAHRLSELGHHREALPRWYHALCLSEQLHGEEHLTPFFLAWRFAQCNTALGLHREALPYWRQALELCEKVSRDEYATPIARGLSACEAALPSSH